MKRSEAIKRFKEIHDRIYNVQMIEAFEESELVDMLLERVEVEMGMLPPQNTLSIHHYNLDALQALTSTYHKWDKE